MSEKRVGYTLNFFIGKINDSEDKGKSCGYAIPLNSSDKIKRLATLFSDIDSILFDELQPENNVYVPNEVEKFLSITYLDCTRETVSKDGMFLCICVQTLSRWWIRTMFSWGLVIESTMKPNSLEVMVLWWKNISTNPLVLPKKNRGFPPMRFQKINTPTMGQKGIYLNDNSSFVEQPSGQSIYVCTLRYKGKRLCNSWIYWTRHCVLWWSCG